MNINENIIQQLKTLAHSGTHPKVWVSAALVYRNKVISYGVNQMKSHPFQKKYARNEEAIFFHAENSAIYIADRKLKFDKFENSVLYISRIKYKSTDKSSYVSGLSLPCEGCLRCIKDYGIKTVVYSLDYIEGVKENYGILKL